MLGLETQSSNFPFWAVRHPASSPKGEASDCDLPSLLPLVHTVFLSSQRPATPHPVNGHPALPYARIRGSSGSFVVLPVLEENTLTEGLGTASTWGKAIARAVDSRQYLGHCAYGYECVLKLPVVGSAVPSIVCESRQYLGQSIVAWLRMRPGTASTQGTAIPPCPRLFLNPASIWGKAQWAWL